MLLGAPKIQQILDTINSPNLAYIELSYDYKDKPDKPLEWAIPRLQNLQNLKLLDYSVSGEILDLETEETWKYLKAMMKRDVFLRVTGVSITDLVYSPWRTAFKFASGPELDAAIKWIVDGEEYYQREILGHRQYELDIRDLSSANRNRTLEHMLHHPNPPSRLKISVTASDCAVPRTLYHHIPQHISHLDVYMMDRIEPDFIPALLTITLGKGVRLRSLSINVFGSLEQGPRRRVIVRSVSHCKKATYVMLFEDPGGFLEQYAYQFLLTCKNSPQVKHTEFMNWERGTFRSLPQSVKAGMQDVLKEVSGWFRYSNDLREIQFNLLYGEPGEFCFDANEVPDWDCESFLLGSDDEDEDENSSEE